MTEDRIQVFHLFILAPSSLPYFWNVAAQSFKRASQAFFMAKAEPGSHTEGDCIGWGQAKCAGVREAGSPGLAPLWVSGQVHEDTAILCQLSLESTFILFLLITSHLNLHNLQDNILP